MAFKLSEKRSPESWKLAQMYWDFITLIAGQELRGRNINRTITEWSGDFQNFLVSRNFASVRAILLFYIDEYKNGRAKLYYTPTYFLDNFPQIERRYRRGLRPIPENELDPILHQLSFINFPFSWDDVITAVSRSVYRYRVFINGLLKFIPDDRVDYLNNALGGESGFVVRYIKNCAQREVERVQFLELNYNALVSELRRFLTQYGYPQSERDTIANGISELLTSENEI